LIDSNQENKNDNSFEIEESDSNDEDFVSDDIQKKADQFLANWQRAEADLSNYRKQTAREREEAVRRNTGVILGDILPVLDDIQRAFDNLPLSLHGLTWINGILLIYRRFESILKSHGVEEIEVSLGEQLDPNKHQAVAQVDGELGAIINVVQKGYMINEYVLRSPLVTVGNGSSAETENAVPSEDEIVNLEEDEKE
tara:strand:- start:347 stop:937 length:591 start_codon:yes stop_codon:yes gene_type:complete